MMMMMTIIIIIKVMQIIVQNLINDCQLVVRIIDESGDQAF